MNNRDLALISRFIFTKLALIDKSLRIHFSPTFAQIQANFSKDLRSNVTIGKQFAY
jgi:hypothetical protein